MRRLLILPAVLLGLSAAPASACISGGYSYAAFYSDGYFHGVAATITQTKAPFLRSGHVAGWIGFGEPGDGPHGEDEWLQVGINSAGAGSTTSALYYEVYGHGITANYHELIANVPVGEPHRVALLEMAHRDNFWRVWLDGKPASAPISLPHGMNRWNMDVVGENYSAGTPDCNAYAYTFDRVRVATSNGGSWHRLINGSLDADKPYAMNWIHDGLTAVADPSVFPPQVTPPPAQTTVPTDPPTTSAETQAQPVRTRPPLRRRTPASRTRR